VIRASKFRFEEKISEIDVLIIGTEFPEVWFNEDHIAWIALDRINNNPDRVKVVYRQLEETGYNLPPVETFESEMQRILKIYESQKK